MSSTVTYKGNTLTTVDNATKRLLTAGKYMEDDVTITDVSGGGTSPWTKVGTTWELTVSNYTSTTASAVGSKVFGSSIYAKDKIVWVRIRDKAGKRKGYFIGSDVFIINPYPANGATTTVSSMARMNHRYSSAGAFAQTANSYGVYAYSISSGGNLTIRACYNASNSLTIDGTYLIDVFTLDYPTGYPSIFDITAVPTT